MAGFFVCEMMGRFESSNNKKEVIMKVEYKSLFLGVLLGIVGVFCIFYLFGDIQTEFSFTTGEPKHKIDKNIEVRIEKTNENGEDITNVFLKGTGDVTRDELEKELEKILQKQGIDRKTSNMNIEMDIQS